MKKLLTKKINSKGAVSIFLVMSVLAVILAIALGSSFIASTEIKSSLDSGESVAAYYVAESGTEYALYDKLKGGLLGLGEEPAQSWRCAGSCSAVQIAGGCCAENWSPSGYCLNVTETTPCDYNTITKIISIGNYRTTRRSIEIGLAP